MTTTWTVLLLAVTLASCTASDDRFCEQARTLYERDIDAYLELMRHPVPRYVPLPPTSTPTAIADLRDETRRQEAARAAQREHDAAAWDHFEGAYIVVEQNPRCFSPVERQSIERGYMRSQRGPSR